MTKRNLVRFTFGFMYIIGSMINFKFILTNPQIYRSWADSALLFFYREIMLALSHQQLVVILLVVVMYEFTMGLLILGKGIYVKVGFVLAIIFHIIITPWGYWSLPNLLLLLVPLYLCRKDFETSFIEDICKRKGGI